MSLMNLLAATCVVASLIALTSIHLQSNPQRQGCWHFHLKCEGVIIYSPHLCIPMVSGAELGPQDQLSVLC